VSNLILVKFGWNVCNWRSQIFDLRSRFQDGGHDVILRRKLLPPGERARNVWLAPVPDRLFILVRFVAKRERDIPQRKCLNKWIGHFLFTSSNTFASALRNTVVQLLALYTDPERHNAQRYCRRTVGRHDDANSRSYSVAVRPAKRLRRYKSDRDDIC